MMIDGIKMYAFARIVEFANDEDLDLYDYVIYERGAGYWSPNRDAYTKRIAEAGRFRLSAKHGPNTVQSIARCVTSELFFGLAPEVGCSSDMEVDVEERLKTAPCGRRKNTLAKPKPKTL